MCYSCSCNIGIKIRLKLRSSYKEGMASGRLIFIGNLIEICHLFQNVTRWYRNVNTRRDSCVRTNLILSRIYLSFSLQSVDFVAKFIAEWKKSSCFRIFFNYTNFCPYFPYVAIFLWELLYRSSRVIRFSDRPILTCASPS